MERVELGTGIGWRPEIADGIGALPGIDWVEVVAENVCPGHLPDALRQLRERGTTVIPHGVSLGLGGAERPDASRLSALAERAEALGAPLVTEHIAFVRAGGAPSGTPPMEAGHLLPVPRTRDALRVLCENVRIAQDALPVPLAVENIAALVNWPQEELTEGQFLAELVERTGVRLLIDVANLHTNHVNRGEDPATALDRLPLEALAYVHVAGGLERDGVWHDTHAHPVSEPVLGVLAELASRTVPPGVLLERDENFPPVGELAAELDTIRGVLTRHGTPAGTPPETVAGPTEARPETARAEEGEESGEAGEAEESEGAGEAEEGGDLGAARGRLARAQAGLLAALVAGAPVPGGFDRERLAVQSRALTAKRTGVVAKLAPELPLLLGESAYRSAFAAYAHGRPLTDGHRYDALGFAGWLLDGGSGHRPADRRTRRALRRWLLERSGPAPLPTGGLRRLPHLIRTWW